MAPSMSNAVKDRRCFLRLPKNVVPKRYDITLRPNLEKFTFVGKEEIDVRVVEATNKIVLNANELKINSASFTDKSGKVIAADEYNVCKETEEATIVFAVNLEQGEGKLSITFDGILNDKLKGFYRSKYTTPEGEKRFSATTHFEPTGARSAFPCWDEPAVKAKFDITLIVPNNRVALSNMNIVSEKPDVDPNYKVVKFATTPIMSTYLVAFIVGEYDFIEGTSDGVKVRVYTPLQKGEQGRFALEIALKALPFYSKYFTVPYPLSKMDLIAIADFPIGAMENWGLVTFREICLLADTGNTSTLRLQRIAEVVCHELSHMWFGNLVTMEWWTDLWLKEGFATFMALECADKLLPHYNMWNGFVTNDFTHVLHIDGLHSSHPIEVPVEHPSEIAEIFDEISYEKGASVIRMLYDCVGEKFFKEGLALYLKKHSYKNAVTEDLWNALEEASKKPISTLMSTYTKQKGHPVISVTAKQEGNNRVLTLTQEKFCLNGKLTDADRNVLWFVPISISTQMNPKKVVKQLLLQSQSTQLVLENVAPDHWVKLNPGSIGFYRVNYASDILAQILPSVKDRSLPALERLGFLNDVFAMVQSSRLSTDEFLKLLNVFVDEDNYNVWSSINFCLSELNNILLDTDYLDTFHSYGRKLLNKIHAKHGWDAVKGETHFDALLRNLVIGRLASFGDKAVIEEAKKRFKAHVNGTSVIPPDYRLNIYSAVACDCDDSTFDSLFTFFQKVDLSEEKNRICYALAVVNDPLKLQRVLDFAISSEVRSQDLVHILSFASSTKEGRELTWQFFKNNHSALRSRYEGSLLWRLVQCVTRNFASEAKAQEIEEFFTKHPFPEADRALKNSLESVRLKAEWLSRDSAAIEGYLKSTQQ